VLVLLTVASAVRLTLGVAASVVLAVSDAVALTLAVPVDVAAEVEQQREQGSRSGRHAVERTSRTPRTLPPLTPHPQFARAGARHSQLSVPVPVFVCVVVAVTLADALSEPLPELVAATGRAGRSGGALK